MATNDNAITEYIKRVGKSITYAASEILREQMPVTTSFISTGSEAVKEIVQDMPGVKEISEKVTQLQDEYIFKPAEKLVQHLKEDIRTGNFYHPERQEESDLDMIKNLLGEDVGAMLNGDFDFDEEGGDEDIPVKGIPTITRGESIVANSVLTSARKSTNAISNTIARFGQANMKSTKAIASMQYAQGERQNLLLDQGFSNLSSGMNAIIEFNNKVLLTHTENSKLFYDSMTKMTQENNAILKEMIEISRGTYKQSQEGEDEEGTQKIGQIFKNGIIDLKEYFKQVQANANNTMIGTIMQMLPMVPMMIKDIVDNPMNFISKQVISTIMGPQLKLAMKNFDRTLGGFMQTMLGRLYDYGQSNPDSILGQIARVFGHKETNTSFRHADTSKYNKGPMAWNGIANRTLVEVIPGYLARIEAALTNAGERYFDNQQGKWISANQASKKEKAMDHRAQRNATRAFKDTMRKEFAITYPLDKLVDANTPEEAQKQYEAAKKMYAEFNKKLDDLSNSIFQKGGVFDYQGILEELQQQYENGDIAARQLQDALIKTKNVDPRILPEMTKDIQQYYSDKRQMIGNMDVSQADNIINMIASGGMKGALFRDTTMPTTKYDAHRGVLKGLSNGGITGTLTSLKDNRGMTLYDYQYKIYRELYTIRKYGLFANIIGDNNDSLNKNIRPDGGEQSSSPGTPPNKPIEPTDGLRVGTNENGETTYNGFTEEELNNFDTNKPARGKKYAKQRRKVLATRRLIQKQRDEQKRQYEESLKQQNAGRIIPGRPVNFVEEEEEFWSNPEELNKKKQKEARSKKISSMYADENWRAKLGNERSYWELVHGVKLSAQEDFDPIRFNEDPEYRRRVLRQGDKKNEQIKKDNEKQALEAEKSILQSAMDMISGDDKQKYPKGVNPNAPFLEQLTQAAGIGAKMKVISNNINNLTRAPSAILSSVLSHADNFMFELMYGKDTQLKDKRGKEIKGIFNLMIYKTEEATDKLNNYIDDLFTDTIAKFKESALGQFADVAKDWFGIDLESFMTQGRDYVKGFTRVIGDSTKDIVKSGVRDVQRSVSDILPNTDSLKMANEISGGEIFAQFPWLQKVQEKVDEIHQGRAQADAEEAKEQAQKEKQQKTDNKKQESKKEEQPKQDKKPEEPQTNASGARQITKGGLTFISPGEAIIPANLNPWNPNRNNVDINLQQTQENRMKQKYLDSLPNSIQKARAKDIPTHAKGAGFFSGFTSDDIALALQALGMGLTSKNNAMGNILGFLNTIGITNRELAGIGGGEFSKISRKLNANLSEKNQSRIGRISNDLVEAIIYSGILQKLPDEQVKNFYAFVKAAGYKGPIITKDDYRRQEMANKDMEDPSMINSFNIFTQNAFGTDINKAAKVTGDVITKNFPELAAGGIVGALASTIFPLGGPLFGAVAGAALNTLSHNKTFNEFVFGKWIVDNPETGQGHLEEGLLPQSWVDAVNKYLPDIKGFGIGGTVAGLFTPFGPLGGAMIGAGIGILKNNDAAKKFLFGEDTGLLNKDRQAAIKRAFPNISAASLGMMLLDPFGIGILSSAVLGSGLGLISTTDGFKNAILGTPGRDGIRRGGLAEALKWQVTEPFKLLMKDMRDNLGKWFRRKFLEPMGRAFTSVGTMLAGTLKEASIWAFDKLANKLHGTIVDKFFNRLFKGARNIIKWPFKLVKGAGKVVGNIFSGALNTVSEFAESRNLANNRYASLTAEERLNKADRIGSNYTTKGIDEYLSSLDDARAQEFARMVETVALVRSKKGPNSARNAFIREQNQALDAFHGEALKINEDFYNRGDVDRDTYSTVLNIISKIRDLTKSGKYGQLGSYIKEIKDNDKLPTEYRQKLMELAIPLYDQIRDAENRKEGLQNSKYINDIISKIEKQTGVSINDVDELQKGRLAEQMRNEMENRRRRAAERNPDQTSMSTADQKLEEAQTKILSDNQLAQLSEMRRTNENLENLVAFFYGEPMPHKLLGVFSGGIDPRDASRAHMARMKLDAEVGSIARVVGANQEDLQLRANIAREELGKGGEATLHNLSDETLRDLYAYRGKKDENAYKYNLLYNLAQQSSKHKSTIEDTDALLKYKADTVRVVTQLTASGYTIDPGDYEDIDKLTPAGIFLVLELAKRGAVFKNFKSFGAIKDDKDGWDKAKSIISLYNAKLRNGRIVGNIATANNLTESMISTQGKFKNLMHEANAKDWQTTIDRLFNAEDAIYSEDILDDMSMTSKLDTTTRASNYEAVDTNELANSAYREAKINKAGKRLFGTLDKGARAVVRFGTNNSLELIKIILDEFAPRIKAGSSLARMREIAEAAVNDPVNKAQHLNEMAQLAAADTLVNNPVVDTINQIIEGKLTDTGLDALGDAGKSIKDKVMSFIGKEQVNDDTSREEEAVDQWINSVDQAREGKRLDDLVAGNKDKDMVNWAIDGASVVRNKDGSVSVIQDDPVHKRIFVWTKDKEKGWLNPVQFSYSQSEEIQNILQTRRDAVALQIVANMGRADILEAKAKEFADYAKEYGERLAKAGLDVTGKAIKAATGKKEESSNSIKEEQKKQQEKVEKDIKETESTPSSEDQTSAEREAKLSPLEQIRKKVKDAEEAIKREETRLASMPKGKKMKGQDYKRIEELKKKIANMKKDLGMLQDEEKVEEQKEKDAQAKEDQKWLDNPGDLKKAIKLLSKKIKKAKTPEEAAELEKQLQDLKSTKKRLGINAFGTPFFNESLPFMIPDTNAFGFLKNIAGTFFSGAKDKLINKIDGNDNKQQPPPQPQQPTDTGLQDSAEALASAGTAIANNAITQQQQASSADSKDDNKETVSVNGRILQYDNGKLIVNKDTAGNLKKIDEENEKRSRYYDAMIKMANAVTATKNKFNVPKLTTLFEGGLLGGIKQLFDLPFQMLSMISPGLAQLVKGGLLGLLSIGGAGFKKLLGKGLKGLLTKVGLKDKIGKWATDKGGHTVKGAIIRKLGLDKLLEVGDFAGDQTNLGQNQLDETKKTNSILQRLLDYFTGRKTKDQINKESDQEEAGQTADNDSKEDTSTTSDSTTDTSSSTDTSTDSKDKDKTETKNDDKKDEQKPANRRNLKDAEVSKDEIFEPGKKNKKGQPIRKKNAPVVYEYRNKFYRVPDQFLDRWNKVKKRGKNSAKKKDLIEEMHAYNRGMVYDPKTKRTHPIGEEPPKSSTNNNSITQQVAEDSAKKNDNKPKEDQSPKEDTKSSDNKKKDDTKTTNRKRTIGARLSNFLGNHKKLSTGLGLGAALGGIGFLNSEYNESNVGYLDRIGYGLGLKDHYDPNEDKEIFAREYEHLMYYYPDSPHVDPSIDNLSLREQDMLDKMTEQGLSAQQKARALYGDRMREAGSSNPNDWDYYSNMEYVADGAVNNAEYAYNTGSDLASQAYDWATSDGKLMNNTAWLATKGIGGAALNFALVKGLKQKPWMARSGITALQTIGDAIQSGQGLGWHNLTDFVKNYGVNYALDKFIFDPAIKASGRAWRQTKLKSDSRDERDAIENQDNADESKLNNEERTQRDISETERTPENRPDNRQDDDKVDFKRRDGKKDNILFRGMTKMASAMANNKKKTIAGLGLLGALGYNFLTPSSSEAAVRNPYTDEPMTAQELYGDEYPTDSYANTSSNSSGGIVDSALGLLSDPLVGTVAALGAPALTSFLGKKFGSKGEIAGDLIGSVLSGDITGLADVLDPDMIMDIKDRMQNKEELSEEERAKRNQEMKDVAEFQSSNRKSDEDRAKEYFDNYLEQEREKLHAEKEANKKSIFQRGKDKLSNLKESVKGIPTKVKDSKVLNKINNSLGGLTDKVQDKAAEDAIQKQSILGKVKEGIKTVIRAIGKWLPSKGVKSAVSNFGKVLLERCKKPEFIAKIMKKVARQAAGLAAGAATMGIGLAAVTIAGAVSDFIHGYNSVDEMLQLPAGSASTGMKVVAGLVTAICGAIPFLPLPEDLVLQLAIKYVGPAFGFGEKELEDLRRNGNKEDQEEAKTQEQASTFGSEWEKTIKNAATGVVGSVVNTARSASAAIADKARDLAKTTTDVAKDAYTWVSDTAKDVKDWVFDTASKGYDYLSKKAGDAWNTAKEIGSSAWNAAKSGASWVKDKLFGSGKEPIYGMSKFYSQLDPRYAMGYNDSKDTIKQSMYDSGCGPMAAMNAISALNGKGIDPKGAATYALKKGYKEKDGGTKPEFFKDYMSKAGFHTQSLHSTEKIKDQLRSGNPVILMGKNSNGESNKDPYGRNPHYVTATGLDKKGNILIQDPESYTPNKVYKASNVLSKSNIAISASKPTRRSAFGRSRFSYTIKYGRGNEESTSNNGVPQKIWDFLTSKGLGSTTVAAIIGNIGVESAGFQLDALSSDGHESYGLCQWTAGRKDRLFQMANSMGKSPSDLDVQLNYLWSELQGSHKHALDATVSCGDNLEDATETFCRKFEVPDMRYAHLDRRIEIARQAFQTQGKGVATSGTYTPGGSSGSTSKKNGGLFGAIDSIASIMSAALNPFSKASASPAPTTTTTTDPKAGNTAMMTDYAKDENKTVSVTTDKETGEKKVNVETFDNALGNSTHISAEQDAMATAFGNPSTGSGKSRFINRYGRGLGDLINSVGAALFPDPKELLKQSEEKKDPKDNGIPTGNEEVNPAADKEDPEKTKEEKEQNKENKEEQTGKAQTSSSSGGLFGALESKVQSMVAPLSQAMSKIGSTVLSKMNEGPLGQVIKLFFGDNNPFMELFGGSNEEEGSSNGSGGPLKNIQMAIKGSVLETLMNAMPNQGITSSYADTEGRPTPGAHGGIDIAVAEGTDLPSPIAGKVVDVGYEDGGYGNFVQIQDAKGNYHMFAHLSQQIASEGQQVKVGDIIAKTGNTGASTGPHLHYQVDPPDNPGALKSGNHLNPATYAGAGKNRLGTMFGMGTSIFDNANIPDNPEHIEDYMTPSIMEAPDTSIINDRPIYGMGSFFGGIADTIKSWSKKISDWTDKTLGKEIKSNKDKEGKIKDKAAETADNTPKQSSETPTQVTNNGEKIEALLAEQKKTNDLLSKNNELLGQLVQIAAKVIESGINGNKQNTPTMNTNTRLPEYTPETATVKAQLTKMGNGSKYGMGDKFYDKDEAGYNTIINIMNALASR